jgi:hypothetical protein
MYHAEITRVAHTVHLTAATGAALTGALADSAGASGLLMGMAVLQFAGAATGLVLLRPRRDFGANPS